MRHFGAFFASLVVCVICFSRVESGRQGGWIYESPHPLEIEISTIVSYQGMVYVFGTHMSGEYTEANPKFDRVWILDIQKMSWTSVFSQGDVPQRRSMYCSHVLDEKIVIFGGRLFDNGAESSNDLYSWDPKTYVWEKINPQTEIAPTKRMTSTCGVWKNLYFIYGGSDGFGKRDLWSFNMDTRTWNLVLATPATKQYVPVVDETQMVVHKDRVVIWSGLANSGFMRYMWTYDIPTNSWLDPVSIPPNIRPRFEGTASLLGDKMYVFGGTADFGMGQARRTNEVIMVDLATGNSGVDSRHTSVSIPITLPTARTRVSSTFVGDKLVIVGGLSESANNDFWVYDTVSSMWVNGSVSLYPMSRVEPHIVAAGPGNMALFGGKVEFDQMIDMNDLWIYRSVRKQWERLSAERKCTSTSPTCVPNVQFSSIGYYEDNFFVFGGFSPTTIGESILRRFSMETRAWSRITVNSEFDKLIGQRTQSAFTTIGSKFYMWGGPPTGDVEKDSRVLVFDMATNSGRAYPVTKSTPEWRRHSSGFTFEDNFCFMDPNLEVSPKGYMEVWCWTEGTNTWQKITDIPDYVQNEPIVTGDPYNIFIFGGQEDSGERSDLFLAFEPKSKTWQPIRDQATKLPARSRGRAISNDGFLYIFGGLTFGLTNGLYSLQLDRLWCKDVESVTNSDRLEDGSGIFKYYPGSQCQWQIKDANFILVNKTRLGSNSLLTLETQSTCDENIEFQGKPFREIPLDGSYQQQIIRIPSHQSLLSLNVSRTAIPDDGFLLNLFNCGKGWLANSSGCYCPSGRFVTFRNDCVEYTEHKENDYIQLLCLKGSYSDCSSQGSKSVSLGESVEITNDLPPLAFALGALISDQIYLMGGSASADESLSAMFMGLDQAMVSSNLMNPFWKKVIFSGDIPKPRIHSCLVESEGYGILVGGLTSEPDSSIYHLDVKQNKWQRMNNRVELIGPACASHGQSVYVYGGRNYNSEIQDQLHIYSPKSDALRSVKDGSSKRLVHAGMFVYRSYAFVFGGFDGNTDSDLLLQINLETGAQTSRQIKSSRCLFCEDEGGECLFGRQKFVYGVSGNHLHVYGGHRQGEALSDVLSINIDTAEVEYRDDYGLSNPSLPLSHPPPKSGATGVFIQSSLLIVGGIGRDDLVSNDRWLWDTNLLTWTDSSIFHSPIHRVEASFAKESETSVLLFGGATQYIEEVLLNDLWRFDLVSLQWTSLSPGSSSLGPAARASATVGVISGILYVMGGRLIDNLSDKYLWAFDLSQGNTWQRVQLDDYSSKYQRPFMRQGAAGVVVDSKLLLWGGQIRPGTGQSEFYSSAFLVNFQSKSISPSKPTRVVPKKRRDHGMCDIGDGRIIVTGGTDFGGNILTDSWIYQNDTWRTVEIKQDSATSSLQNPKCATRGGFTISVGMDDATGFMSGWMLQGKNEYTRSKMFIDSDFFLNKGLSQSASVMLSGLYLRFGGKTREFHTNVISAYRPGFCNPTRPTIVESNAVLGNFDDGSGVGKYLLGTNCTWHLISATHIVVRKSMHSEKSLIVFSLGSGKDVTNQGQLIGGDGSTLYTGPDLAIRMEAITETDEQAFQPCEACEGFEVHHIVCPNDSSLDWPKKSCVCNQGLTLQNGICAPTFIRDSKDETPIAIGSALGGVVLLSIALGFWYRKRVIANIADTEKKLYVSIPLHELQFFNILGEGSFGKVYRGEWRGTDVAIKKILDNKMAGEQTESFKREIAMVVQLRHPNIVLYMGACFAKNSVCIVSELMEIGTLHEVLHDEFRTLAYPARLQFALDISRGMNYLHSANPPILHKDLKSLNVLVDQRFRLKVSDFGMTALQGSKSSPNEIGSLLWMAPEVLDGKPYELCADVYSFGIILWEIMTREEPYHELDNTSGIPHLVGKQGLRPTIPKNVPEEIVLLMQSSWDQNPNNRTNFQHLSKTLGEMTERNSISGSHSLDHSLGGSVSPPEGSVAVVCARISGAAILWEDIPDAMGDAIIEYFSIVRKICDKNAGYISQNDGEVYVIGFRDIANAVRSLIPFLFVYYLMIKCHDILGDIKMWCEQILCRMPRRSSGSGLVLLYPSARAITTNSTGDVVWSSCTDGSSLRRM
eukprot:TRINITY_DN3959_c0_g1_i12.p1 TRINITY_DN3959_c0_g1~~TRINITY_DN3959_c0_g1_i12.p1  ORF type:complete len:2096 (+),score=283.10 TRINITY_DN3959_c0_g1_i12:43-6330(+)